MFRAFALAIGISLAVLGAECLFIEKVVMAGNKTVAASTSASVSLLPDQLLPSSKAPSPQEVVPPEWAPWGLLIAGSVIVLYSFTIPRRVSGGG